MMAVFINLFLWLIVVFDKWIIFEEIRCIPKVPKAIKKDSILIINPYFPKSLTLRLFANKEYDKRPESAINPELKKDQKKFFLSFKL